MTRKKKKQLKKQLNVAPGKSVSSEDLWVDEPQPGPLEVSTRSKRVENHHN